MDNGEDFFKARLKSALIETGRPPFLFVGSGVSIRYCAIPTWLELLKMFVEHHRDYFEYEFGYYSSKCSNNPMEIATILASEFHEAWWKSGRFSSSKKEFSDIAELSIENAFKIELAKFVKQKKDVWGELKDEIALMSKATVSGILTTNWDDFLQTVFWI